MQIKRLPLLLVPGLLLSNLAFAAVKVDQPLPAVAIEDKGELLIDGDDARFESWSSDKLTGRIHMIQHIAGRTSAKELNSAMIDAIIEAKLSPEQYQTVTVINVDDALWGTSGMVRGKAEDSKREFPHSAMVLDEKGEAQSTWALELKSSAIILVDTEGKVLFAKDGLLEQADIDQVLTLIQENLPQ